MKPLDTPFSSGGYFLKGTGLGFSYLLNRLGIRFGGGFRGWSCPLKLETYSGPRR
jgi:hypothetical protein